MIDASSLTPLDIKEHAVIERWRANNRIRDELLKIPPEKKSSIYQNTLTKQINDKIVAEQSIEKLDLAYIRDTKKYADILKMLDERQRQDRQNLARELNRFRENYQQKRDSREDDLECPKVFPQRESASLGSCLIFEGEDLYCRDRQMHEQRQMKKWLEEQWAEKLAAVKEQEIRDHAFRNQQMMFDEQRREVEQRQINDRRRMENDLNIFNQTLANEKRCQRQLKAIHELEDKKEEIQNMWMNNPRTDGRSHRVIRCIELLRH